ncbi:DUF2189 domain-containing protein [Thalassorhabdomicrobium marinisediminis]|uniref:DUF2189 domain-containing protein n=1 Tax=Thalassorhabdomicrobium marinisediminis TaxID=2170577 RepID=A0A2T7FV52_9RHOB|nr:DUF2189 domain-containing protein [Thalassorhabdomicrobium marinisediminis]PVA06039.1 hypothetical protein DC363_12025 [Thalassorhabdomicrobium marinisediminis]
MLEPLPTLRTPIKPPRRHARGLPASTAFDWLSHGWQDFRHGLAQSLVYGVMIVALSYLILWAVAAAGMLYLALPMIAGFLIIGPFFAVGLYEKSRALEAGEPIGLGRMLVLRGRPLGQLAFAGLMLGMLVLSWIRTADLLYALFFGLTPYPGAEDALVNVLTTPRGWMLILTGTATGALFAAFAFALSLFSIPMIVAEKRDALTALGTSFVMTTQNLAPTMTWGAIVAGGILLSFLTGLLGLAIVFPILGHGTWHAYRAIRVVEA